MDPRKFMYFCLFIMTLFLLLSCDPGVDTGQAPSPPQNVTITMISDTELQISWTDASSNETGFFLERGTTPGSLELLVTLDMNTSLYTDTNLQAHTEYFYCVIAYNSNGESSSEILSGTTDFPALPQPLFSPPGGTYDSPIDVSITCFIAGAVIIYTTDGTEPSTGNGSVYSAPLTLSTTTRLKAFACMESYRDSPAASALFTITTEGTDITIIPEMDEPVEITFSGQQEILGSLNSMTVVASTSVPVDFYEWYLNNVLLSNEDTDRVTMNGNDLAPGGYTLACVVTKGNVLSSEYIQFDVISGLLLKTLDTTLAAGNGTSGVMFNVTALTPSTIYMLGTHGAIRSGIIEIWYRRGGLSTSSEGWVFAGSTLIFFEGEGVLVDIPIELHLPLSGGETIGFYVTGRSQSIRYSNSNGGTFENFDISVDADGYGVTYLFGNTYSPRTFNGRITYY